MTEAGVGRISVETSWQSSVSIRVTELLIVTPEFLSQQGCGGAQEMCISNKVPGEADAAGEDRAFRSAYAEVWLPGFSRLGQPGFQWQICPLLASGPLGQRNCFFSLNFFSTREINKYIYLLRWLYGSS